MQEWQNKKQFSPENVFELLQASLFLLALGRLLELLQTNVAMGWSSAAAGGVLLFVSSSRQTLKHIVPVSGGSACSGHLAGDATGHQQRDSAEGAGVDGRHGIHSADLRCPGKPH